MPGLDLHRVDGDLRGARELVGRAGPGYPDDPAGAYREACARRRGPAILDAVAQTAEATLQRAIRQERQAREAQELAVDALRHLGAYGASWERIGVLLGVSAQAAHKRYAELAARPRAELTIDDLLGEPAA